MAEVSTDGRTARTPEPVTERQNPITLGIDRASPSEILKLLSKCDEEMFKGFEESEGLCEGRVVDTVDRVASVVASILQDSDNGLIVFSGCGTSGRIGFITARTFNRYLVSNGHKASYNYIIAGGDRALLTSQELYEDDPIAGAETLKQMCDSRKRVLYIGITCGLSAPFVAGQLDYCLQHPDVFTPVMLGFNSVEQARNRTIEKWDKTFLQVAQNMEEASRRGKAFVLNPMIGPESITGSSRMKGGSATKILLDIICVCALWKFLSPKSFSSSSISDILTSYKSAVAGVYKEAASISPIIKEAGDSLKSGAHIYYVGKDTCGILGIVDASECRPTYGAALTDVRGYVEGGYEALANHEGDLSHLADEYQISAAYFNSHVLPRVSERDLVIYCNPDSIAKISAKTVVIRTGESSLEEQTSADKVVNISLPNEDASPIANLISELRRELVVKLVYNAVSTGAHVIKGKVYQNLMIDVRISNNKLYHRSLGIIQRFSNCSAEDAECCLLRSIYGTDRLSNERTFSITTHIEKASPQSKVVPVALVLAVTGCDVTEARRCLLNTPVVAEAIAGVLAARQSQHAQAT